MAVRHNLLTLPAEIRENILRQLAPTTTIEAHLKSVGGRFSNIKGQWKFFFGCRDCDIKLCPWPRKEHVVTNEVSSRHQSQREEQPSADSGDESSRSSLDRVERHALLGTCRQLRGEYVPLLMQEALFCLDLVEDPVPKQPLRHLLPAYFIENIREISIVMHWSSKLRWLACQLPQFTALQNVNIEYMNIPMVENTIRILNTPDGGAVWAGEQAPEDTPEIEAGMKEAFTYQELGRVSDRTFKLSISIRFGHFDVNYDGRHLQGNTLVSGGCLQRLEAILTESQVITATELPDDCDVSVEFTDIHKEYIALCSAANFHE